MSNLQELSAVKLVNPICEYQADPLNPARGVALRNCHVYISPAGAYILWDKYDSYACPFDPFTNKFLDGTGVNIESFQVGGTILIWETEELQGDAPRKYVIDSVAAYANPQEVESTMGQATIRITLTLGSSEDVEVLTRVSDEGPDFEHLTHNENFDYYFTDLVTEEPSSWDSPLSWADSPVKFSPEEFLKRQYPGYAWVVNRNLVVMHEQSNGLGFTTPDINTDAKFLRIRTFGPTKANNGIKEISQLGTNKYFYIEKPTAVQAAGAKYPMYAYIANLDDFFTYDWMFLEALHAVNPEVLYHFKFYDRFNFGQSYNPDWIMPTGVNEKDDFHTMQLGDLWYNEFDVLQYCGKNNWVDYVQEPYRCFSESDTTTWIKDPGEPAGLALRDSLKINYADYVDTQLSSESIFILQTSPIRGQLDGTMYEDLGVLGNKTTEEIYETLVDSWESVNSSPGHNENHPENIYNFLYDDSVYNHNGKYTYLVIQADAIKNKIYRNTGDAIDSAGNVETDSAGTWVTASTLNYKNANGASESAIIDNQNLFYLIPIDNADRIYNFGSSGSGIYRNSVSWLLSALSKQQVQITVRKTDGTTQNVTAPGIFSDIQNYVVGKIVIDASPLELGMASFNSDAFYAFDNKAVFLTDVNSSTGQYSGNGLITLIFSMGSTAGIKSIAIPAILVGENGINFIELNNYSSFASYSNGLHYFKHFIELLGENPPVEWNTNTEPMLCSPAHLKHEWKIDGKQAPVITADMIDLNNFLIKPWKVLKKLQANSGSCQWKYDFPDIRNKYFPWDDMESHLTVQETRQSPMAIDGQTTAFYSNALSMNQSTYAYAKNNDFSDKWTKLQNKMATIGSEVGLAGGLMSGAGSGAAEGAKIGGPVGAGIGTFVGAASGLAGGLTNYFMTKLENENRSQQLAMNENIAQSQNAYQNLSLAQSVNKTMSIPVSIAPLNVKNTDLVGKKAVPLRNTYREPDITRETALLRWQHLGYPFGMKAHFVDYDNRVNYNVVTVDWLNKEHYIKESIFTWLENNLIQKSLFLFADEICLSFLSKLTGFYRLWHVVPSIDSGVIDAQIRSSNIEHSLVEKINNSEVGSNGLPVLRYWPLDVTPWWKKPYSDFVLYSADYLEQNDNGEFVYYGIGNNAFEGPPERIGLAVWQPIGDVVGSSISFRLLYDKKFPYFDDDYGTITVMWTEQEWSVDPATNFLTIRCGITLDADPAPSSIATPSSVYGQTLAVAACEISWEDSKQGKHSKLFILRCIPRNETIKQLRDLASGDIVRSIKFNSYPVGDGSGVSTAYDHAYDVNFKIVPTIGPSAGTAVLACQYHTVTTTGGHAPKHERGYGNFWSTDAQADFPNFWWYNLEGSSHWDGQDWQNFLAKGNQSWDNGKTFTVDKSMFDILRTDGYHPDFPYCRFTLMNVSYTPDGTSSYNAIADVSKLEFGQWDTVPSSAGLGVFNPIAAEVEIAADNERRVLAKSDIPCVVDIVE